MKTLSQFRNTDIHILEEKGIVSEYVQKQVAKKVKEKKAGTTDTGKPADPVNLEPVSQSILGYR